MDKQIFEKLLKRQIEYMPYKYKLYQEDFIRLSKFINRLTKLKKIKNRKTNIITRLGATEEEKTHLTVVF